MGQKKLLKESIIDETRSTLDPDLIGVDEKGEYYVLPEVEMFIYDEVSKIYDISQFSEFFIKGSSLTFEWMPQSDIDLYGTDLSLTDDGLDGIRQSLVRPFNKEMNLIPGTEHPLELYIDNELYFTDKADVMWDLLNHKWIKPPKSVHADISKYWDEFEKTVDTFDDMEDNLYRDIIDYELLTKVLKDAFPEEKEKLINKINNKLEEIEATLDAAQEEFQDIKDIRHAAFDPEIGDKYKEILKELKSRNLLPDNVVFKLAQRYFYLAFLKMLKDLGEDESKTEEKIDNIKKVFKAKSNYLDSINESARLDMECLFLSNKETSNLFLYLESMYSDIFVIVDNSDIDAILMEAKEYTAKSVEKLYEVFMDIHEKYPAVVINVKFPTRGTNES